MSKLAEIKAAVKKLRDKAEKDEDIAERAAEKTIQDYRESQTLPVSVIYKAFADIVAVRREKDRGMPSSSYVHDMSRGDVDELIDDAINLQEAYKNDE